MKSAEIIKGHRSGRRTAVQPLSILCVDGDPYVLETLQRFFRRGDFQVLAASNVEEAVNGLSQHAPIQIVIADLHMPGMNGIDFFRIIETVSQETIKILTLEHADASHKLSLEDKCLIDRCIFKPWSRMDLRDVIAEVAGLLKGNA